jgi:hypothetical protein
VCAVELTNVDIATFVSNKKLNDAVSSTYSTIIFNNNDEKNKNNTDKLIVYFILLKIYVRDMACAMCQVWSFHFKRKEHMKMG